MQLAGLRIQPELVYSSIIISPYGSLFMPSLFIAKTQKSVFLEMFSSYFRQFADNHHQRLSDSLKSRRYFYML